MSFNMTELVEKFKGEVMIISIRFNSPGARGTRYFGFASKELSNEFSPHLKIVR